MVPTYGRVVSRAARETWRIVIAHSWGALAYKVLAVSALIFAAWSFTQITPANDDFVLTDQITVAIVALGAAVVLVLTVFLVQLLFVAPFQLYRAEWGRAEAAEARCGQLAGGGPIDDRTSILNAALFIVFGEWNHSTSDLTPEDALRFVSGNITRIIQGAIDGQLAIWVRKARHDRNVIKLESAYWHTASIDPKDVLGGEAATYVPIGGQSYYDPQVRKSDIEWLYGPKS